MHPYPRLTTIMKRSQPKYGAIHTDGPSKVMTMLVYMNDEWGEDTGGRLSWGCIVMHTPDITALYDRIPEGAMVVLF